MAYFLSYIYAIICKTFEVAKHKSLFGRRYLIVGARQTRLSLILRLNGFSHLVSPSWSGAFMAYPVAEKRGMGLG